MYTKNEYNLKFTYFLEISNLTIRKSMSCNIPLVEMTWSSGDDHYDFII